MSDDVLITPASRKIEFKDSGGTVDAKIETDSSGNLVITNPGGDISLGDTTADVIIGDGVNSVDLIMEVNGEIRGATGITITLGDSGSNISMGTDLGLNSNDITGTGNIDITGGITVTGNVTASSFYGDGSNLTGITAGASAGTSATLQTKINALSATMATSVGNSNTARATLSATMATSIANSNSAITALSATMATSIGNSNTNITTNAAAITSINGVLGSGAFASVGTSATLQTKINAVSATMATSIGNQMPKAGGTFTGPVVFNVDGFTVNSDASAVFNGPTRMNSSITLGNGSTDLITGSGRWGTNIIPNNSTSRDLGTDSLRWDNAYINTFRGGIDAVLTTVTDLIYPSAYGKAPANANYVGTAIATKASVGTSATLETRIAAVSATMATSINNSNTNITTNANAITSINGVLGTGAFASAGTSATLQTKINAVSATMATSIGNSNSAITALSATMATSIGTKVSKAGDTMTGDLLMDSANSEINIKSGVAGTTGRLNWTFNTTTTNYASLMLPYDTRTTTGFHMDVAYPITIDATTKIDFSISGSNKARIESDGDLHVDGNVIAYSTTISDKRLKKDIAPIDNALWRVSQLNGCTFTYLKDDRKSAGLIAQDLEKVLPSAVIEDEAVFHGEEGETYKTVQYDQVIGLLVEAVKELAAKVEELENASTK